MAEADIIDTHLHLVDRSKLTYAWIEGAPTLNRDWPLAEYADQARRVGISSALHMEVDVIEPDMERETDMLESIMSQGEFDIHGVIAGCRPESDGKEFDAFLERASSRESVVGVRRILHEVSDDISQTPQFRENIRKLAKTDLPFDVCMFARQLPLTMELVDSAPDTRFVLDHCGNPDIEAGAWDDWAKSITELAKRDNLVAKLSGVVAYTGGTWTLESLSRWVEHVAEAFGPDRICWGGDWPVCTLGGGIVQWAAATRAITASWSADERAALYSGNAKRIWKL